MGFRNIFDGDASSAIAAAMYLRACRTKYNFLDGLWALSARSNGAVLVAGPRDEDEDEPDEDGDDKFSEDAEEELDDDDFDDDDFEDDDDDDDDNFHDDEDDDDF